MTSASVRDDFEVEQRLSPDPPHLLHVLHAGDAGDDRAENDRRDDHLDQLDEAVTERLHGDTGFRVVVPEEDTAGNGRQYLEVKMLVKAFFLHGITPFSLEMVQRKPELLISVAKTAAVVITLYRA